MIKGKIAAQLQKIVKDLTGEDVVSQIDHPADERHGDYSSNIAMAMFSSSKFKVQSQVPDGTWQSSKFSSPLELAKEIAETFNSPACHRLAAKQLAGRQLSTLNFLDRVEAVPPGFINFWLSKDYLQNNLSEVLEKKEEYGKASRLRQDSGEPRKIMVEYTDPNPFKELHIGHLYSNIIGESLAKIFEAQGAEVCRVDYFGDVGMHVAKAIWGLLSKLKTQNSKLKNTRLAGATVSLAGESRRAKRANENGKIEDQLAQWESKPLDERIKFLGEAYALGSNEYPKSKDVQEEVKQINKLIYIAAQNMWQKEKGLTPQIDYQKREQIDQDELEKIYKLYTAGRKWSLDYFETLYKRLGTKFDKYYPESIAGEWGYKVVMENLKKGIFAESDGAIIFPGKDFGLHTRVFINALGLPTYEAKELGLAPWKYSEYPYDLSFIITANEIADYFRVLVTALQKVNPELGEKTKPILHGMVTLPEGKMSSRFGNVITVNWLIDEAKRRICQQFPEMNDKTAEQVALGAIKFALLKSGIGQNIKFSFDESISFEGNSGPYLQYTYARTQSVLLKSGIRNKISEHSENSENQNIRGSESQAVSPPAGGSGASESLTHRYSGSLSRSEFSETDLKLEIEEQALLRSLHRFPEVVEEAARNYAPNLLCNYLFGLAQKFNLFYQKHSILGKVILESANWRTIESQRHPEGDAIHYRPSASSVQHDTEEIQDDKIREFRLALTFGVGQVLQNGLHLLGIKSPEHM